MSKEADLQGKLVKYLKGRGCYVIKTKPGSGVPVGCPDLFAFIEGLWMAFECKASKASRFQPLQKETLAKLSDWSYARVVYPENYDDILDELDNLI